MIKVLSSGFASIQDLGRFGFRQKGIPTAGVMDVDAFNLCNGILQNTENTPVIEYCKSGFSFQVTHAFSCCFVGQVEGISINNRGVSSGKILVLNEGDIVDTGKVKGGTFAYFGIAGEFRGKHVLGSSSVSPHVLTNDWTNFVFEPREVHSSFSSRLSPKLSTDRTVAIECDAGPEWYKLLTEVKEKIHKTSFHLSRETWRMAFKLQEKVPNDLVAISSSPVLPGTVQLTPAGDVLILMRDAQTTGGYPRILQLTEDAINKLCRVGWGGEIKFDVYL